MKFLKIVDVAELVDKVYPSVKSNIAEADKILKCKDEPQIKIGCQCHKPYDCGFLEYCKGELPANSVFDIYRMDFEDKAELYNKGIITFSDLKENGIKLNEIQQRQLDYALEEKPLYVNRDGIISFLNTLSYPLYFLDFETMQMVIPEYVGAKPNQQIPFQYSLHYYEQHGGELKHKEFLAISGEDPRRALAERLVADIPADACVLAYNKKFECGVIKNLAELFPDLSNHLLKIRENIKDLLDPFQKGYYYNRAIGGSFSIKSVLPAIYPADPNLNYHNLDDVHNGTEAMTIFPKIKDMPLEEQERVRANLLKYCCLDTYAMVKVLDELYSVVK